MISATYYFQSASLFARREQEEEQRPEQELQRQGERQGDKAGWSASPRATESTGAFRVRLGVAESATPACVCVSGFQWERRDCRRLRCASSLSLRRQLHSLTCRGEKSDARE